MAAGSPAGITFSNTSRMRALLASSVIVFPPSGPAAGEQARVVTREGGEVARGASGQRLDRRRHPPVRSLPQPGEDLD